MTSLAATAAVSRRASETSSRLEKVHELAEHLRRLALDEIPIAIAFLSRETRQGKLGVAYAALRSAEGSPAAAQPELTLQDVDAALATLAATAGQGSTAARA